MQSIRGAGSMHNLISQLQLLSLALSLPLLTFFARMITWKHVTVELRIEVEFEASQLGDI
jgi:hypothetical protein